jgi:hypothetical protein
MATAFGAFTYISESATSVKSIISWSSFLGGGSSVELAKKSTNDWESREMTARRLNFTSCCLGTASGCFGHICYLYAKTGSLIKEITAVNGQGYTGICVVSPSITAIEDSNFIGITTMITIQMESSTSSKEIRMKNCRFKDNGGISGLFMEVGCLPGNGGYPNDGSCPSQLFVLQNCQIEQKNPDAYGSNALSVGVKTDQFHFAKDQIQTLNFDYLVTGGCQGNAADSDTNNGGNLKFSESGSATDEPEKEPPNVGAIVGGAVGGAGAVGGGIAAGFILRRKFGQNGVTNKVDGIDIDIDPDDDSDESSAFDDDYDDDGHRIIRSSGMETII